MFTCFRLAATFVLPKRDFSVQLHDPETFHLHFIASRPVARVTHPEQRLAQFHLHIDNKERRSLDLRGNGSHSDLTHSLDGLAFVSASKFNDGPPLCEARVEPQTSSSARHFALY